MSSLPRLLRYRFSETSLWSSRRVRARRLAPGWPTGPLGRPASPGSCDVGCLAVTRTAGSHKGCLGSDCRRRLALRRAEAEGEGFEPSVDRKAHNGFREKGSFAGIFALGADLRALETGCAALSLVSSDFRGRSSLRRGGDSAGPARAARALCGPATRRLGRVTSAGTSS
jgi:hypothetical protein